MRGESAGVWTAEPERGNLALLRAMTWVSLRLGRPVGRAVLVVIAMYFLAFAPRARRTMRVYLARALGRAPRLRDLYRLVFSFASTIHDRVYLLSGRDDLFDITIEGEALVAARCAHGDGAFLMGAHFGSFEVMRALGRSRPGVRVAMAMYAPMAQRLNNVLSAVDPAQVHDIIPLGTLDAMLRIGARLDAGDFVGMLGDRSFGPESFERVDFLGAPADFPTGAMRVAALLRRPAIFMAGLYRGGNRYHIVFEPLADFSAVPRGEREAEVRTAVRRYAAVLERRCRQDPWNWFNFYDFWRSPGAAERRT